MRAGIYRELYETLGLTEAAGTDELRRAYLALVVKHHPDRNPDNPDAENRFKQISEAYAILSDPEAKARYGRMREAAGARASSSASGRARPKQSPSPDDFAQWLRKRKAPEAYNGGFWDILMGLIPGTEAYARRELAKYSLSCELFISPREAAEGLFLEINPSNGGDPADLFLLHIPAGTKDGDRFRIAGRGQAGLGVGRGDLFITVKIRR